MKHKSIISFIIYITITAQAIGCNCKDLGRLDSLRVIGYNISDIVFLGELIDIDTNERTYSFRIIEIFKGENNDTIIKGKYFDSCSKIPKDKCKWIVYADFRENLIDISSCLATRSEENPICTFCYKFPPPGTPDNPKSDIENEKKILNERALSDWKKEIILLREWKKKPAANNVHKQ
jgi:hypothetical protein